MRVNVQSLSGSGGGTRSAAAATDTEAPRHAAANMDFSSLLFSTLCRHISLTIVEFIGS
jgi:hypothetical protein